MPLVVFLLLSIFHAARCNDVRPPELCLNLTPSPQLERFVDELPEMPVISLLHHPFLTLGAYKIKQKLHRDLPETTLYAFGVSEGTASYPGPTLFAQQGKTATVRWENHIPDYEHMLPLDRTVQWADPHYGYVPITIHNHGQEDEGWSDGHPDSWFTRTGEHGSSYVTQNYVYPNDQLPTMLWYHDHTVGVTRLNNAAGMVGAYIINSATPEPEWLPRSYRVLVVQDKAFYDDGSIKYPSVGINPSVHPSWCPEYLGDVVLVNGKAWPYLEVDRALYRFRLVNAGNSRTFVFSLSNERMQFFKIGTDQGLLSVPIWQPTMRVSVAERVDWLLDFRACDYDDEVELTNIGPEPFPAGPPANQPVLLFRVVENATDHGSPNMVPDGPRPSDLKKMKPLDIINLTSGVDLSGVDWSNIYNRPLEQVPEVDSGGNLVSLLQDAGLRYEDPATEVIQLYSSEVWCFINFIQVAHAMHTHLVAFRVLEQQPFDPNRVRNGTCSFEFDYPDPRSCYTDEPRGPDVDQLGLKDSAVALPFFVTRFFIQFRPNLLLKYSIDPTAFPGYVHHCHLMEHEDNEMMRPLLFSNTKTIYQNSSFPHGDLSFLGGNQSRINASEGPAPPHS